MKKLENIKAKIEDYFRINGGFKPLTGEIKSKLYIARATLHNILEEINND